MTGGKKPLRPFQCADSACILTSEIIDSVIREKFLVWLKSVDFLLVILGTDKPANLLTFFFFFFFARNISF